MILVTSMMQGAHEAGLREFDLYGVVPPKVRDHAWSGFSDFKRSFGGHQVDFSGTWELPVKKLSYAAYNAPAASRAEVIPPHPESGQQSGSY